MATGTNIRTYFDGAWHEGDIPVIRAADHGAWLGSSVFDGARYARGLAPDLIKHCERLNASARALMITPTLEPREIHDIVWDGLRAYPREAAVYIRPLYWALDGDGSAIMPKAGRTGFSVSLEEIPLPSPDRTVRLTTTRFTRPTLATNLTNAKAGCLYPNNARMIAEARSKGYDNALVADAMGNVAESASANVFMVRQGVVFTPIANGTFLAGITRARHISNLRRAGYDVHEAVLSFDDFHTADEVFLSGNMSKVTPVSEFDGTRYPIGAVTQAALRLYWEWAAAARDHLSVA